MNKVTENLKEVGVFFIATLDGDQPRVRPFGAAAEFEGKTYICTNNTKACFKEMSKNPKIEISAMYPGGEWLRLSAVVKRDERREAKTAMLEQYPELRGMYNEDDGIFEVLYLENTAGVKASFTAEPETIA